MRPSGCGKRSAEIAKVSYADVGGTTKRAMKTVNELGVADSIGRRSGAMVSSARHKWGAAVDRDELHDIVQVRITLQDIDPPIWRRVQVPADFPLRRLHDVIQAVMGWLDYHLHQFEVGDKLYGQPEIGRRSFRPTALQ